MDSCNGSPEIMWRPDRNKLTKMDEFRLFVNEEFGLKLGTLKVTHIVFYLAVNDKKNQALCDICHTG